MFDDVATTTPLSARSVALSVLLGAPNGHLPVRDIVAIGETCGVAPATMRVALSRLAATGELVVADGIYSLSPHHRERLRDQHEGITPRTRPWRGEWETVVIVESGRGAAERARLRNDLTHARLAELREGVWMRPANLDRPLVNDPHTTALVATPADPHRIVATLWDLDAWAARGRALLEESRGPDLDRRRFTAVAALVRHLRTDPALPPELTPSDWPAAAMRDAYDTYRTAVASLAVPRQGVPA